MVKLDPGKDFNVIVISIDPSEGPQLAAKKKAFYLKRYGTPRDGERLALPDWAEKSAIDAVSAGDGLWVCSRVPGPDGTLSQFAHASSIEVVTTDGKLAQYYLGVEYSPKDILLGLIEASGNKIGSPVANISDVLLPLRSRDQQALADCGAGGSTGRNGDDGQLWAGLCF